MPLSTKITLVTSSIASFPLLKSLNDKKRLLKVIIPKEMPPLKGVINQQFPEIAVLEASRDEMDYGEADAVVVFGFGRKLELPEVTNAINVHFGPLPENRGPDPVFWTLKEGKKLAYITLHKLTDKIDTGAILKQKGFTIYPGENYGMLTSRLGMLSVELIEEVLNNDLQPTAQDETHAVYKKAPREEDLKINWEGMTASDVERLVLACNPKYGGAKTSLQGKKLDVFEVTPANVNLSPGQEISPGMLVHVSREQGVFVACKDQTFVRLDIISSLEGLISGPKLAAMGVRSGSILGA